MLLDKLLNFSLQLLALTFRVFKILGPIRLIDGEKLLELTIIFIFKLHTLQIFLLIARQKTLGSLLSHSIIVDFLIYCENALINVIKIVVYFTP